MFQVRNDEAFAGRNRRGNASRERRRIGRAYGHDETHQAIHPAGVAELRPRLLHIGAWAPGTNAERLSYWRRAGSARDSLSLARVPGLDARIVAHRVMHPHQLRKLGEDRGRDVVDFAAEEPA